MARAAVVADVTVELQRASSVVPAAKQLMNVPGTAGGDVAVGIVMLAAAPQPMPPGGVAANSYPLQAWTCSSTSDPGVRCIPPTLANKAPSARSKGRERLTSVERLVPSTSVVAAVTTYFRMGGKVWPSGGAQTRCT